MNKRKTKTAFERLEVYELKPLIDELGPRLNAYLKFIRIERADA